MTYHRGWPWEGLQKRLTSLYIKTHGPLPKGHEVAFANSRQAVAYFQASLKAISKPHRPLPPPQLLARSIYAVPFHTDHTEHMEELQTVIGARPSSYQAKRVLCGNIPLVRPSRAVDNCTALKPLMQSNPNAPSNRLRLASPNEGTGALAHTAADLVDSAVATLINSKRLTRQAGDAHLKAFEKDLNWMENDEAQLITHFIRSGHQEFNLLDRAVDNANFVREHFFTGQGEHAESDGHHQHLPFAMVSQHSVDKFTAPSLIFRNAQLEPDSYEYNPFLNIDMERIRIRASFAFSETTLTDIPDLPGYDPLMIRVAFGQESKAELY